IIFSKRSGMYIAVPIKKLFISYLTILISFCIFLSKEFISFISNFELSVIDIKFKYVFHPQHFVISSFQFIQFIDKLSAYILSPQTLDIINAELILVHLSNQLL